MGNFLDNNGLAHYASKMTKAENRTDGRGKTLSSALKDINNKIDELEMVGNFNEPLDMTLENTINTRNFKVGCGDNTDKSEDALNGFSEVCIEGNSLVNLFDRFGGAPSIQQAVEGSTVIDKGDYWEITMAKDQVNTAVFSPRILYTKYKLKPNTKYCAFIDLYREQDSPLFRDWKNNLNLSTSKKAPGIVEFMNINETDEFFFYIFVHGMNNTQTITRFPKKFIIVEGSCEDIKNKPLPDYFTGLQSVGELQDNGKYAVDVVSTGKNLFDKNFNQYDSISFKDTNAKYEITDSTIAWKSYANNYSPCLAYHLNLAPNTEYVISCQERSDGVEIIISDGHLGTFFDSSKYISSTSSGLSARFISRSKKVTIRISNLNATGEITLKGLQIETGKASTSYKPYKSDKKQLLLNEPFRALPNGVKDTIEKVNCEWKVVRRCEEILFDGTQSWEIAPSYINGSPRFATLVSNMKNLNNINYLRNNIQCDNIPLAYENNTLARTFGIFHHNDSKKINVYIEENKLSANSMEGFRRWCTDNPFVVIYELETPIYEDIPEPILQIWNGGHILIDTTIPPSKTTHTVPLNKAAQISSSIEELCKLRNRVETLEEFYNAVALEQARDLTLLNNSIEVDYLSLLED